MKNKMQRKSYHRNISMLLCLVTTAASVAGCGSWKKDIGSFFNSEQEREESYVNSSEKEKSGKSTDSSETGESGKSTDSSETGETGKSTDSSEQGESADSSDTAETGKGTDSSETGESADSTALFEKADTGNEMHNGAVFEFGRADTISVDISAANAIVTEADTNFVLYQKNSTARIAPASTAKMIIALTALDFCSTEENVTAGTEITMMHADSSRAWLNQGDTLTIYQLLTALLLPSGNDAAYSLAVYTGKKIAGSNSLSNERAVDVFMNAVNEKAKKIGAVNSNFTVPDGYDAEGQYTTACDLAVIAKACLENPDLAEIMAKEKSYERWTGGREVTYHNSNKLLDSDSPFYYPEVIGMKTGTSSLAGASLVSAAVISGKTYISVVMGASSEDSRVRDSMIIYDAVKAVY